MARKTEKYDPLNPGVPTVPRQTNWDRGSNVWVDTNGNVIRADEFSGRTSFDLTDMPCGVNTIGGRFTGNTIYEETDIKSVTVHNGDCLNGTGGVQQLVAGPGIYLSAPNGLGRVIVSTRPLNPNYNKVDYYSVTWPVTTGNVSGIPLKFFVGGNQGANTSSRDGFNWGNAEPNPVGADIATIIAVADSSIPDYHVEVTGSAVNVLGDPSVTVDTGSVVYGRLGWNGTTTTAGYIDSVSNIQKLSSTGGGPFNLSSIAVDRMTAIPTASGILYLTAAGYGTTTTNTASVVVTTTNAIIYNGKPNKETGSGVLNYESLLENVVISGFAHNATTASSSFTVIAAGDLYAPYTDMPKTGRGIYKSSRSGTSSGTWTQVLNTPTNCNDAAYGEGIWVVVGEENVIYYSSDTTNWTAISGPIPGASWNAVAYGNGKFIAVGGVVVNGEVIAAVAVSENGSTWTKGSAPAKAKLNDIAYSPQLNVFVAVGESASIVAVEG